jgi:hypothetical protein
VHDKVGRHSAAIADFDEASAAENRRVPSASAYVARLHPRVLRCVRVAAFHATQ